MGVTNLEYMPAFSNSSHTINDEENKEKSFTSLYLAILSFEIFVLIILWQLFPIYFSWFLKCVILIDLLVSISWELTYFDSLKSDVELSSPPSPPKIRLKSGYVFHINYVLASSVCVLGSLLICYFI